MKILMRLIIISMLSCSIAKAQQPIDELIASEKNFANTSKEQSTKKAFISFVDSNCVGFSGGEQVNIFKEWMNRKEDGSKLTWAPEFAVISSSGEMGVTTGPWEYREKSLLDTVSAHGHFATVWKKNRRGEWKAVFDIGINYPEKITNSFTIKKIEVSKPEKSDTTAFTLMSIEMKFNNSFAMDHIGTLNKVLLPDSWFNINGLAPFKNATLINIAIDSISANASYRGGTSVNFIVSTNGDMFATYGSTYTAGKKQSYMRLWIKQNEEWKLQMMVVH